MVLILYQFGGFLSIDARNGYRYSSYYEKVGKNEVCIDDEIPFELPDGWAWTRLSAVCEMYTGDSINETEKKKKYMGHTDGRFYIGTKDVGFDHVITYDNGVRIPYEEESKFRIAPSLSTLLCVEGGSAGRKIAMLNQAVCFGNKLCCFVPHSIDETYLYYYLQSPSFISVFKSNTTGIIGGVSINTLKGLLFAIPPLSEQHRIVQKLLLLSPYIAEYNEYEQAESLLNEELPTMIRKSILQYAIQGKLVPQDPSDEPASVLLERIRNEREKANGGKKSKAKTESYIFKNSDDNSYYPFDIPKSWEWVCIGDIADIKGGKRLPAGRTLEKTDNGHIYIRVTDMKNMTIQPTALRYVPLDIVPLISKYTISKDDLYLTIAGTIGAVGIVPKEFDGMNLTENAVKLTNISICKEYLMWAIASAFVQEQFVDKTNQVAQPKLAIERIQSSYIPLPPIKEQVRIANRLKYIFDVIPNSLIMRK